MIPPLPFYASKSIRPPAKRLLIISYHFPPSSAVGGLRWQKLTHFLVKGGWGVDVVCLDPAFLQRADPKRLLDLPNEVRLYGVPEVESISEQLLQWAYNQYRKRKPKLPEGQIESIQRDSINHNVHWTQKLRHAWLSHANFAHMKRWADHAAERALKIAHAHYRAVITSGPPHMVHFAGERFAKLHNIPLVIDMRDPWSLVERVPRSMASPLYFQLAARHERRILEAASLIIANTEPAAKSLQNLYPGLSDRIVTIMNGCDNEPLPLPQRKRTFVIAYAGEIYIDRDPRLMFRAMGRVVRALQLKPEHIAIRFIGDVESLNGVPLHTMAQQEGIGDHISLGQWRPRQETLQFLADANMLVLLPQDSHTAIPSKLFEYLCFPSWVLALAEDESATGLLLRGSGADLVRPNDVDRLTEVLQARYLEHVNGVEPSPIMERGNFDRRIQAAILLRHLDLLTA